MGIRDAAAKATLPTAPPQTGATDVLTQTNEFLDRMGFGPLASQGVPPNDTKQPTHAWWLRETPQIIHVNGFYGIVGLPCTDPSGKDVTKWVRFSGKTSTGRRGAVMVIKVGDYIVLVRQFRLPILFASGSTEHAFTNELPRYYTNGDLVRSLHDGTLHRIIKGKTSIQDENLLKDARTLLGSEAAALLPHATLKRIEWLGAYSEWNDESTIPVDVFLVEFDHLDVEVLRHLDLGPAHMKIRLYPFSQLLKRTERERLNLRDTMSLAGLGLAWGRLMHEGRKIREITPVTYEEHVHIPIQDRSRLDKVNQRLTDRGHALVNALGTKYPGGEIDELKKDTFFSSNEDGWEILQVTNRLPNGVRSDYFIRFQQKSTSYRWDTLVGTVNGQLLALVGHHLPGLAHKEKADKRAWCPRVPLMLRNAELRANGLGKVLGDTRASFAQADPLKLVMGMMDGSKVTPGKQSDAHEDTGTCAVTGKFREVEITPNGTVPPVFQAQAKETPRLVLLPPSAALQDPTTFNLGDFRTIAALFGAAETGSILSEIIS